ILNSVDVVPCDTRPCTLYKGEDAQISVKLTTSELPVCSWPHQITRGVVFIPIPCPPIRLDVEWELKNGNEDVVCELIPVQIR
ncbi:hypothetical protein P879_11952, partial [Paragonimus westermani]